MGEAEGNEEARVSDKFVIVLARGLISNFTGHSASISVHAL
jgi:hypothetical protein